MPARITPERLAEADEHVRAYYRELSNRLMRRGLKPLPEVRLYVSRKLRKNYGYAAFRTKDDRMVVERVAIAWSAYRQGASMWQDVVAHEAAHAYCMAHHSRADHSPAWRHVARLLGATGDVMGCEDAGKRHAAQRVADHLPTVLTKLTPRDQAALRLSFRAQRRKHRDDFSAIGATVRRFPQFEERRAREYLAKVCGLTLSKHAQMRLPF